MKRIRKYITLGMIITGVLIFFVSNSFSGVGSEGLQFLKIKPAARPSSIGYGYVGMADDVNATFYNPAGIAFLSDLEISFMHMVYVAETSYEFLTAVSPVDDNLRLGMYLIYLNYGSMANTQEDINGTYTGSFGNFSPYNLSACASIGYSLFDEVSIGANVKYALEDINGVSTNAIMFDAGFLYRSDGLGFGVTVYNLGSNIGDDKSPIVARAGLSQKFAIVKSEDLVVAAGANYVLASAKISESIGLEYWYDNQIGIRCGYGIGLDAETFSIGAGLKSNLPGMKYGIDYNFSLLGDMGAAHRISLTVRFAEDEDKSKMKGPKGGIRRVKLKDKEAIK